MKKKYFQPKLYIEPTYAVLQRTINTECLRIDETIEKMF